MKITSHREPLRLTRWELMAVLSHARAALRDYEEIRDAATPELRRMSMTERERLTLERWRRLVRKLERV